MLIALSQCCINPTKPTKQAGFAQQVNPIFDFHDDLQARIIAFKDKVHVILVSLDNLGFPYEAQLALQNKLREKDSSLHLVVSSTHTHFGGDPKDIDYIEQLSDKLYEQISQLNYVEYKKVEYAFQYRYFDEVGKSRISDHTPTHIYLELIHIYADDKPLIHFMIHNAHPTILSGLFPSFSAEYPGYSIRKLKEIHPNQFFTFMQGADGDVSSRFTRSGQQYENVIELGNKFVKKVVEMMEEKPIRKPLDLSYEEVAVPLKHQLVDLNNLSMPSDLTERELETIEFGKKAREAVAKHFDELPKEVIISKVDFNGYCILFEQNELFSDYISALHKEKSSLACYSNGYGRYVTPIGWDRITYEYFTDTFSDETKKLLIDTLHQLSK